MAVDERIIDTVENSYFSFNHKQLIQARIISPVYEYMENSSITPEDLSGWCKIPLDRINDIISCEGNSLTMEELASISDVLSIVIQTPIVLDVLQHKQKFYK